MTHAPNPRVGVVHWGTTAPSELVVPLTDVHRRRAIERGLEIPPTLGGNNFPGALSRCREVVEDQNDDDRVALVVTITDGIETVGADASAQISQLPAGCVHVLLVDHSHGCGPELEAGWSSLPLGSFTRLDVLDTTRLAWEAAEVVARAAGLEMPPLKSATSKPVRRR
jgi:hypothetical protein